MIGIGEFAYSTGLSIKTLRYYHEIGLLPPAEIDEFNGYRSYRAAQMKDAALLRVLRASGMGIAQMKQALSHPDDLPELLAQRRKELEAQRALEDWALGEALKWQAPIDVGVVQTRHCPPQPWVGVETEIDLKELLDDFDDSLFDQFTDQLEVDFESLTAQMAEAQVRLGEPDTEPSFWINLDTDPKRPSVIRLAYCMGVAKPLPDSFSASGVRLISGVLPARKEGFITLTMTAAEAESIDGSMDTELPGGQLPQRPGIALALAAEAAGVEGRPVRQRSLANDEGATLEYSLTLDH